MLWPTATEAFFLPIRRESRQNWAARWVPRVRAALQAHWTRMSRSQTLPLVVRPERFLPPVTLLPGQPHLRPAPPEPSADQPGERYLGCGRLRADPQSVDPSLGSALVGVAVGGNFVIAPTDDPPYRVLPLRPEVVRRLSDAGYVRSRDGVYGVTSAGRSALQRHLSKQDSYRGAHRHCYAARWKWGATLHCIRCCPMPLPSPEVAAEAEAIILRAAARRRSE